MTSQNIWSTQGQIQVIDNFLTYLHHDSNSDGSELNSPVRGWKYIEKCNKKYQN